MTGGQDDLDALRDLVAERAAVLADLDARERVIVKRLREQEVGGFYSYRAVPWDDIAKAAGVSRQAIMKRHAAALEAEARDAEGRISWSSPHRRRYDAQR
jgi:hypothetical protein